MHPAIQTSLAQQLLESRIAEADRARAVRGLSRSRPATGPWARLRIGRSRPTLARM